MNVSVAIQYALLRGMQSFTGFNPVTLALGREYIAKKIAIETCWQTKSPAGNYGIGMVIQVPQIWFPKPNSLQRERVLGVAIYENPEDNWKTGIGTFQGGDDWADDVVDFLWNWQLWRASGLVLEDHVTMPDNTYAKAGILGTLVLAKLRQERVQTKRCAQPVIAGNAAAVTLTVSDGSAIYYTIDGVSTPSPKTDGTLPDETAAVLYAGPFAVAAGTIVRAGAFTNGLLPSNIVESTIN